MNMINVLKRLAELDAANPKMVKESKVTLSAFTNKQLVSYIKENIDQYDAMLIQKFVSGEIDRETLISELESAANTDHSMRQGEMGMQGDDTPAGNRAWDREQDDYGDEPEDDEDEYDESAGTHPDRLQARTGMSMVNKVPRPGQTDLRNIPAGNYPGGIRKFSDQDRARHPGDVKAAIKAQLGKHRTPNLPESNEGVTMEQMSMDSLRLLAGMTTKLKEHGIETVNPYGKKTPLKESMMSGMGGSSPASINMTAGSGSELTGMLRDIMALAGVHQVTPDHMPMDPVKSPAMGPQEPDMKALIDVVTDEPEAEIDGMNDIENDEEENEGLIGGALGALGGAALGGPLGAMTGYAAGSKAGDDLSSDEGYDNSPDPKIGQDGVRKFGDIDNNFQNAAVGRNVKQTTAESLYADYQKFMTEAAVKTDKPWTSKDGKKQSGMSVKGDKYTGKDAEKEAKDKKVKEGAHSQGYMQLNPEKKKAGFGSKVAGVAKKVMDKVAPGDDELLSRLEKSSGGKRPNKSNEGFADDVLAVAKKINPNATLRTGPQPRKPASNTPRVAPKYTGGASSPADWYDQASGGKRNSGD